LIVTPNVRRLDFGYFVRPAAETGDLVQRGYVLARAAGDPAMFDGAARGAVALETVRHEQTGGLEQTGGFEQTGGAEGERS
jgi:hypothetical protein